MDNIGLFGKKYLQLEKRPGTVADPGVGEVVVGVRACGVCGTDLNFLRQHEGQPMPLGHEIAAEVLAVGPEVPRLKPGDRVIVEDCALCGTCVHCKNGRSDLCREMFDLGGQPGMARYMRVRHNNLVAFDQGLDFTAACLTEPLAVSLNAVLAAAVPLQGSVAVLGCGPLGLMSARVAKIRGAGFVAATEIDTDSPLGGARAALAAKWGCDRVIDPAREDLGAVIRRACPGGVDRVIVSAPPESIAQALEIVAYGGTIVFYGLHFGGRSRITVDVNDLIFRKITLRPVFAEPALNFNVALSLLRGGLVPAADLVTHRFDLDEADDFLPRLAEGRAPVIKAVMRPSGG